MYHVIIKIDGTWRTIQKFHNLDLAKLFANEIYELNPKIVFIDEMCELGKKEPDNEIN